MNTKDCLGTLLNPALTIEQKANYLLDYLDWHACLGGAGAFGKKVALKALFDALPSRQEKENFGRLLAAITRHVEQQREARKAETRTCATRLRDISPGTWIVVKNGTREETVCLLEVRRTRFICEYTNGRRMSAPCQLFVRVHDGQAPARTPDTERQQRELVWALAGVDPMGATEDIFEQGPALLAILLEELRAAIDRVDNAPVAMNRGINRCSIPFGKKVNPKDVALVKRIPQVVALIAAHYGSQQVRKQIVECPSQKVRELCQAAMEA
ncbi:MAG: hypothetical protein NTW87_11055 [Planctomycetota bacterium]|nr:hypothetical protein [Planctomycetota bacterium]